MKLFESHRWLFCLVPVLCVIALWMLLTTFVLTQPRIYPTVGGVLAEMFRMLSDKGPLGSPYIHAGATVLRLLAAWCIAFCLGTVLGVVAGRVRWFYEFSRSLVWVVMAIPSVVWVFIFLIIFGISEIVPIAALVLLLGAPVFIGSAEGVRAVSRELIEMCDSYKVGNLQRLRHLYLPAIAPYIVANARVSFAFGIKIVIIAEVVGLQNGVGILVQYWSDMLYMAPVVAWGVLLILLGLSVDRFVFAPLESWVRRAEGAVVQTGRFKRTRSVADAQ